MASISTYLQKIMDAVYGEEVRGAIHDALAAMNTESSNAMRYAATAQDSAAASASAASVSAQEAGQKATEARASADEAKVSEDNARASEVTALNKATEAGAHAAAASASETNAANSERVATQKAADAAADRQAAEQATAEAAAHEATTRAIRSDVERYGAQAADDKDAAERARDEAETARDTAVNASTNAAARASDALNAKLAAEAAKDAAETSEQEAKTAETSAKRARDDAQTAKDAAEASATSAAVDAQTAKQYSGHPNKPVNGTWHIWNADLGQYEDSGISCELEGPQGVGIDDIRLTSGDHTPGTTDIYTMMLSDGTTRPLAVYNGRNGTGAGDVLGIGFDLVLPANGWVDGVINVYDPQLIASAKFKYLVAADDDSKEEYIDCGVQPKDVTTDGVLTFMNKEDPENDLTVSILRFELGANGA